MRLKIYFFYQVLFVFYFVFLVQAPLDAFAIDEECAQASLEVRATGEPGKFIFDIESDKDFVSLRWSVSSDNISWWHYSSPTLWDHTGTHAEIPYTFPFNGPFRVRATLYYKVEPDNYCSAMATKLVNVSGLSLCAADITPTIKGKRSYEFRYTGAGATNGNNTQLWEFGDGSTSTNSMPSHTYAQDGKYTVKLTRTYNGGCTAEAYYELEVGCDNVTARITSEKYDGPGQYSFSAEVSEEVKNWRWDFGDGESWIGSWSSAYKYDYDGTYAVKYTGLTTGGCTVTAHDTVTITDAHLCGQPTLQIEEPGEPGKFIYVIDSSKPILGTNVTISGIDRQWTYSSGTRWDFHGTHLELYPYKVPFNGPARVYLYFSFEYAPGKYCYTDIRDSIEVRGNPCTATINTSQNENNLRFTLSGDNLGPAGKGTTLWEFGDGSTSTELAPSHLYQQAGTYEVTATRSYYGCTAEAHKTVNVCVSGEALIQTSPTSSPGEYTFTVNEDNGISEIFWSIYTADERELFFDYQYDVNNTTHSSTYQFDANGTYYVWTLIFTEGGCSREGIDTLVVNDFAQVDCEDVNVDISTLKTGPGKYNFTVEPSDNLRADLTWDFGDGKSSGLTPSTHQYSENGIYQTTFTGTTLQGCSVVSHETLEVTDVIVCGNRSLQVIETGEPGKFIYTIDSDIPIQRTNFRISGIDQYWVYNSGTRWDYNGTHLELPYTIPYNGSYKVDFSLQYENAPHCAINLTDTVNVYEYPCQARINSVWQDRFSYKFVLEGNNIGSSESGTTLWEFGDGSSSAEFQPIHLYQPGTYAVKVTRSYLGCTAVAFDTVTICGNGQVSIQVEPTASLREYTFSGTSVDPIMNAYWGIDSETANIRYNGYYDLNTTTHGITHQFNTNGTYYIAVHFSTKHGCSYEGYKTLVVNEPEPVDCEGIEARIITSETGPGVYHFTAELSGSGQDFVWDFGNGETSTAINPQYQYTENGTYEITFTCNTGSSCNVTASHRLVVSGIQEDVTTGIPEDEISKALFVYPNPSYGHVYFSKPVSGVIYDARGNAILKLDHEHTAHLHSTGVYFLKPGVGRAVKFIIK